MSPAAHGMPMAALAVQSPPRSAAVVVLAAIARRRPVRAVVILFCIVVILNTFFSYSNRYPYQLRGINGPVLSVLLAPVRAVVEVHREIDHRRREVAPDREQLPDTGLDRDHVS